MQFRVTVSWYEELVNNGTGSGDIYMKLSPRFKISEVGQFDKRELDKIITEIQLALLKKGK